MPPTRREPAVPTRATGTRPLDRPLPVPLLYVGAGVLLAIVTLAIDRSIGDAVPGWLRLGHQTALSLVTGFGSGLLFVVSVVFMVRIYAVQMSAEPFSARVLRHFLTDRVQRHAMSFLVGALTYVILVARAIPDQNTPVTVPYLSVAIACMLPVVAAILIIYALHNAAEWSRTGRLMRWLTDECVALVQTTHPPHRDDSQQHGEQDRYPHPAAEPDRPARTVPAHDTGWVQRIHTDRLLAATPPAATTELAVRSGSFVAAGQPLATIRGDRITQHTADAVDAAIVLGPDPSLEEDLGYGISQLADIAERSMSQSNSDSTTARQVVLHLGVVLREVLVRDLPPRRLIGSRGQVLLRPRDQSIEDYVSTAFDRIRVVGAHSPQLVETLLLTLSMLICRVRQAGLPERTASLHRQADLVLGSARESMALDDDVERVRRRAVELHLLLPR
jgi:uncharacterized membrane protein